MKIYEEMSWLNGNPLKLVVKGDNPGKALLSRRLEWNVCTL